MDMLVSVMEGAEGPTQIMYRANLSWLLLCQELRSLTALGFIEEKSAGSRKKYALTDKGLEIVKSYLKVIQEIDAPLPLLRP